MRYQQKVKSACRLLKALFFCSFLPWTNAPAQITNDDPNVRVDYAVDVTLLEKAWKDRATGRVLILHIPLETDFSGNVSTSVMDRQPEFSLMIDTFKTKSIIVDSLVRIAAKQTVKPSGKKSDLRWGVIFYAKNDKDRLFSIYFDKTGKAGVVNGMCVTFDSDVLREWAESNFKTVFR